MAGAVNRAAGDYLFAAITTQHQVNVVAAQCGSAGPGGKGAADIPGSRGGGGSRSRNSGSCRRFSGSRSRANRPLLGRRRTRLAVAISDDRSSRSFGRSRRWGRNRVEVGGADGVSVTGTAVAVAGTAVLVGGAAVGVGGTEVAVGTGAVVEAGRGVGLLPPTVTAPWMR